MYYRRLRDMREDHDMTQKQIAEILQTTQQVYSEYELGKREIPLSKAISLAKLYDCSLDYLVGLSDISPEYNNNANNK